MVSTASLSHRLGGLYCLYCLYETQPFKPPFKIYLSLGELKGLRNLVVDAKEKCIIVSALIKKMLERDVFLFGFVDTNEGSMAERVDELTHIQNARVQVAYKKLFDNTRIEDFIHMDLGKEFEVDELKKMSRDYAEAKEQAIREASKMVDVKNIKHIAENQTLIGDVVEKSVKDWNSQKELFHLLTGVKQLTSMEPPNQEDSERVGEQPGSENCEEEDNEDFSKEIELLLSAEDS